MRNARGFLISAGESEQIELFYTELATYQYDRLPVSHAKRLRPSASRCLGSQITEDDIIGAYPQTRAIILGLGNLFGVLRTK